MKRILYRISLLLCLPALALNVEARGASQDLEQAAQFIPQSQSGAQGVQPSTAQGGEPGQIQNGVQHSVQIGSQADQQAGTPGLEQNKWQSPAQIDYADVRIARSGEYIQVTFDVLTGEKSVGRNEKLLLTPVLYNDSVRIALPTITVQGRRMNLTDFRQGQYPGSANTPANTIPNGGRLRYRAQLPDTAHLENIFLRLECRLISACSEASHPLPTLVLTDHPALIPVPPPPYVPEVRPLVDYAFSLPVTSVADSLSKIYPFVAPMADFERSKQAPNNTLFNPNMPLSMGKGQSESEQGAVDLFVANNEKGAMQINFERGSTRILRYYKTNNTSLVTLASVLKEIQASKNSQVEKIVVAGFASPEGPLAANDRLAWERADAVRTFIRNNSTVPVGDILLYNGSEDWRGLRELVEQSDIEAKYEILYIIDNVPVLSGREKQLMDLAGGRPYKFMARYFFPKLRNAAYIKVYYTNTGEIPAAE